MTGLARIVALVALVAIAAVAASPAQAAAAVARREPGMSDAAAQAYAATDALMRAATAPGNALKMLRLLQPIVAREQHPLLVGRLVVAAAAVASSVDGRAQVDVLLLAAGQPHADATAHFVAGVAAHYRGHVRGRSRAEKTADYVTAISHLEPVRATMARAPRLWIYLAVSYLRTGRQREAEAAIARAVDADSGDDADVYYCRAEVYHRSQPTRALADIDRYIAIMARNTQKGAWSAPGKEKKVREMRAHLAAVVAGHKPPGGLELFDPVRDPVSASEGSWPYRIAWALVAIIGAIVAALWWRRLAR